MDASFALEFLLRDPFWRVCSEIWSSWLQADEEIWTPALFYAEATSVIRERTYRRELTESEAEEFLRDSLDWIITVFDDNALLQPKALALATRFNRPKAYDAQYLAVADLLGCELWTADRRLANAVGKDLAWVRYVGDAA